MKAIIFEQFGAPLKIASLPDPAPHADGVVIEVQASGICRSDWHGWQGHDPDITTFPHVPGHELAGIIVEIGKHVRRWKKGDRVTVPFVSGCGTCPECATGNHQICDHQFQPGFTGWGSFAEYVALRYADTNLVSLPEEINFVTAASLGCRFITSFRAVVDQGRVKPGEWAAVHGCGGVGLSAIMIARSAGARVIAVDINDDVLELSRSLGAYATINASREQNVADRIRQITGRGAHLSIDALGSAETCVNSIRCLRKQGRHIQVGLLAGSEYQPRLPMEWVIAWELEILGSHGMQAFRYDSMLEMILSGDLDPKRIVGKTVSLEEAVTELPAMGDFGNQGIIVIDRF